ncbi:AAA family ATPase [Bartonella sp. HY038]|uniref:ATP-binding protein n=1 Tax=Bartonella sp. HY038 TaxID=2759660 RepID=UPI0015FCD5FF|nr:AAA family ATPase [Bartonella sp. HY038]
MEKKASLRQPAEEIYADELQSLKSLDDLPKPKGWLLSPRFVRCFIVGDEKKGISRKIYGEDSLIDRAIVSLMSAQGLMLAGEPGTAKSLLSELLAAAISGHSGLIVQGSAGTSEDHIRYSWNYALLLAEGPSERALVASPIFSAMKEGRIVRFEEITRCPPEVQDALISIMSEKSLAIPELGSNDALRAAPGFNIIATANLRDRGVNEMSSALKRRFNFEIVHPISDGEQERALVRQQLDARLAPLGIEVSNIDATIDILVETFQDLRTGRTREGIALTKPDAVMSTAEAVNVMQAAALEAAFLDNGSVSGAHIAHQIQGVILKDEPEDGKRFKAYIDYIVKDRAGKKGPWREFYSAARALKLT